MARVLPDVVGQDLAVSSASGRGRAAVGVRSDLERIALPTASREYITVHGTGEPVDNQRTLWAISDALALITRGKRVGVLALGLRTAADIENENLDVEQVMGVAGRLPALFVNVTFQTEELSQADLTEWEARFELHLIGELVAQS